MVCGVNPGGPDGKTCEDFAPSVKADAAPEWTPLGGGYYAGDWIPQPFPEMAAEEKLALLDWHPQFTGRCPNCEMPITKGEGNRWDCAHCEWNDSVGEPLISDV